MNRIAFQLHISAEVGKSYVPFLRRRLREVHRLIRPAPRELSLLLATDATMARLHQQFLNVSGTTDVLTFELERSPAGKIVSGEIVLCVDEARRQARRRRIPISHELLLYAVHGLLHLAGYDDLNLRDYQRMHRQENRILTRVGVGPVFDSRPKGRG
jgi:probable rRNA maturation factor